MRRRFSRDQWSRWFAEYESSGLSVAAFCRQIQVNQTSFYLWRRKLKSERKQNSIGSNESLVEISLAETETIRIQLPGGATAFVPNQSESLLPLLHSLVDLDSDS